jgi:hypothetical protein
MGERSDPHNIDLFFPQSPARWAKRAENARLGLGTGARLPETTMAAPDTALTPARDTGQAELSPSPAVEAPASPATQAMLARQRRDQRNAAMTTEERRRRKAEEAAEAEGRTSERVRSRWQTALVAMRAEMVRLREDLSENDAEAVGVLETMLDDAAESAVGYAAALEELRRQRDDALRRAVAAEGQAAVEKQRADRADAVLRGLSGLRPTLQKMVAALPGTALASSKSDKPAKAKGRRRRAD